MKRDLQKLVGVLLLAAIILLVGMQFIANDEPGTQRTDGQTGETETISQPEEAKTEPQPAADAAAHKGVKRINLQASYIGFDNLDSLEEHSDVIVFGTPLLPFEQRSSHTTHYEDGHMQSFYTLTEFKVERTIKDEGPRPVGDTIELQHH